MSEQLLHKLMDYSLQNHPPPDRLFPSEIMLYQYHAWIEKARNPENVWKYNKVKDTYERCVKIRTTPFKNEYKVVDYDTYCTNMQVKASGIYREYKAWLKRELNEAIPQDGMSDVIPIISWYLDEE